MPLVASEHAYIVSDIIPNLGVIPNLRCPDDSIYTKASLESGFVSDNYDPRFKTTHFTWELSRLTQHSGKPNLVLLLVFLISTWSPTYPTWKQFIGIQDYSILIDGIIKKTRRLPMLDNVGHKTVICGPESFTPDSMPLFGETPEVRKK